MASQSGMLDKWFAICRSDLQGALTLEAHEKWDQANLWNSNKVTTITLIFDCMPMNQNKSIIIYMHNRTLYEYTREYAYI